ncbi:hypothetical protein CKO42_21660 [Lamprobacter modestohalophilus]|uniref:Uncharacterized protein n=1 Tax=Lamprobacter modestohalophilus TaxID=1064514 RepID=A0A9X0WCQ9_9GAMM|nr:hypothetical protein [Lamprobacter modestohalophilus]MBK1620981.1 hypothetical protein [Lamprobacter modestohalophilus]
MPEPREVILPERRDTANKAQTLRFLEQLSGRTVFYAERRLLGMATVASVKHDGLYVSIGLSIDPWPGSPEMADKSFSIGGPLSSYTLYSHILAFSAGYGISASLVFDPDAIALAQERRNQGASSFDILRLVRDNFAPLLEDELPFAPPGGDLLTDIPTDGPQCLVNASGQRLFVHPRGLPGLEDRSWETEYPLQIIIALCQHFEPQVPELMPQLLARDHAFVAQHPDSLATIALSADELFAHRPALAMFYHQEYGPYSLNAGLSNEAALRLLAWIGEACGFSLKWLGGDDQTTPGQAAFNSAWQLEEEGPFEVRVSQR